jgi:O-antigen ligase
LLACLALGFGFKGAIVSRADKTGGQTTTKRGLVDEFRLYTWRGTAKMALANPVFGTGPGTFPALYPRYAEVGRTGLAHQSYLQVAAESGIPAALGLLTAALLALASVRRGNLVCAALAGGLLAALLRSCFDSEWALMGNSLPFWTIAGLLTPPINPLREAGEGRRLSGGGRLKSRP